MNLSKTPKFVLIMTMVFSLFVTPLFQSPASAEENVEPQTVSSNVYLFTDDFSAGNLDNWTIVDEGTVSAPSNWSVVNGEVVQSSNIYGPDLPTNTIRDHRIGTFAYYDNAKAFDWHDYSFSATLRSTDNDGIGLMFRYQDPDNYYKLDLDEERQFSKIFKVVDGEETLLAHATEPGYTIGVDFKLEIKVIGDQIEAFKDGVNIFGESITDDSHPTGTVALYSWGNQNSYYRDVRVANEAQPFKIAVLPDTQNYSSHHPDPFGVQTQWIVDNHEEENIQYVVHLGDIVNFNSVPEWEVAYEAMRKLDGVVPYSVTPGNHDIGSGGSANTRETTLYNTYFPVSDYEGTETFGGVYSAEPDRYDNNYHTFYAGGTDWLILSLEFGPRDPVLDWANEVVSSHPDHRVVVVTHAYMFSDETRYGPGHTWNPHNYGLSRDPGGVNDGGEMWEKFVKLHPNITMVLNGHVLNDGQGRLVSEGDYGNKVYQMLSNYQMRANGGNGFLRLLEIDPVEGTIKATSYSPYLDQHLTDWQNEFQFNHVELGRPDSDITPREYILRDTFSEGHMDNWTIVDEGTVHAPSNWSVVRGEVVQSSNIYGPDLLAPTIVDNRKGTFAYYDHPDALNNWKDYTLKANLRATDNDGIGLMFRYQDPDNYYKLDLDQERSFTKLFKVVDGVETTLAHATEPGYTVGANFELEIKVFGNRIEAFKDGTNIFGETIIDDSHVPGTAGTIALYSWGTEIAYFDDVRVADHSIYVSDIQDRISEWNDDGAFANQQAVRALTMHLTAVGHFEQRADFDRVAQHMAGFHLLLDNQLAQGWITEAAYEALQSAANTLVDQL